MAKYGFRIIINIAGKSEIFYLSQNAWEFFPGEDAARRYAQILLKNTSSLSPETKNKAMIEIFKS